MFYAKRALISNPKGCAACDAGLKKEYLCSATYTIHGTQHKCGKIAFYRVTTNRKSVAHICFDCGKLWKDLEGFSLQALNPALNNLL